MSLGLSIAGNYAARGKQNRPAAPAAWLNEVMQWVERTFDAQLAAAPFVDTDGTDPVLFLPMHPGAEPIEVAAPDRGAVRVSASTSSAGPGYHQFVCSILDALASEFRVTWQSESSEDETGYFSGRDRAALEGEMLSWIGALCQGVLEQRKQGEDVDSMPIAIAMPINSLFAARDFATTPLGPRSRAWVEAVAADPSKGKDFFSWWDEGETPRVMFNRALVLMWTDVRWGKVVSEDDAVAQLEAAELFAEAYAADPTLPYPWREWAELMQLVEWEGEPREAVEARAAKESGGDELIGYRRGDVTALLPGGWSLKLPGSMSEGYEEGGMEYVASDGERTVRFSSSRVPKAAGVPTIEEMRDDPLPPLEGAEHEEPLEPWFRDGISSRGVIARITDEEDGHTFWMLASVAHAPGRMGLLSVFFDHDKDREWAVGVWKGITPPPAGLPEDEG